MHREHGHEHEWDVAHAEDRMFSIYPGKEACRVEEEGVYDDDDDVGDAIAIEILRSKVKATRIEVHHCQYPT